MSVDAIPELLNGTTALILDMAVQRAPHCGNVIPIACSNAIWVARNWLVSCG